MASSSSTVSSYSVDQRVAAWDAVQAGRPYSGCSALLGGKSNGYKDSGGTWLLPIACERKRERETERENVCVCIYTYTHTYICNKLKIMIIKLKNVCEEQKLSMRT